MQEASREVSSSGIGAPTEPRKTDLSEEAARNRPQGTRGNFEKSGFRFSMKAFFPSFASSLM